MKKKEEISRVVQLRIICMTHSQPLNSQEKLEFGLQDRKLQLHTGQLEPDGSLLFEIEVPVTFSGENNQVRFGGSYVHGTAAIPFIYLSWKRSGVEPASWFKRLKISLPSLTREQLEAIPGKVCLSVRVSGTGSGTVPLLDNGWSLHSYHNA